LFERAVIGPGPLGIAHEAKLISKESASAHNAVLTFGYVSGRAAKSDRTVSVLDWGGGLGHYLLFGEALFPELEIDYHCKDVPALCQVGREVLPRATFHEDGSGLERQYDLVMASGSLQFCEDWQDVLGRLREATRRFLYVTRIPMAGERPTFEMVQRPHKVGYQTELIGWVLNRSDFLHAADTAGLTLLREFLVNESFNVRGTKDTVHMGGFLFAPLASSGVSHI
jgi:putative methyltransferase (TIGR04325 family)